MRPNADILRDLLIAVQTLVEAENVTTAQGKFTALTLAPKMLLDEIDKLLAELKAQL